MPYEFFLALGYSVRGGGGGRVYRTLDIEGAAELENAGLLALFYNGFVSFIFHFHLLVSHRGEGRKRMMNVQSGK